MLNIEQIKEELRSKIPLNSLVASTGGRTECPYEDCSTDSVNNKGCVISDDTFFCFRCKRRGDVFDWVMVTKSLNFKESLRELASEAGMALSPSKERTDALQKAINGFSTYLRKQMPEKLTYLNNRSIPTNLIFRYQIGYIDEAGKALELTGLSNKDLQSLGLMYSNGKCPLAGRYIFPIRDSYGNPVQLKGRADPAVLVGNDIQKSLPLQKQPAGAPASWGGYSHMNYLYLEEELSQGRTLFVCEGEPDTLTLRAMRIPTVGIQTNTGVYKHASKFRNYDNIYLLLDNDEASNRYRLEELYELQLRLPNSVIRNVELPSLLGEGIKIDVNDFVVKCGKDRKDLIDLFRKAKKADEILARAWGPIITERDTMSKLGLYVRSAPEARRLELIKMISVATGRPVELIGFALDPKNW